MITYSYFQKSLKTAAAFMFVVIISAGCAACSANEDNPSSAPDNVSAIADARVDTVRGSVIVTTIEKPELYAIPADAADLFGPESYHLHDYGFFYNNLKQNVADRIKAFMDK